MAWNLIAPNTWSNSKSPYLIKYDSITSSFIVEDIDGKNFIPLDDIFNNPAFPADFSNISVLGKHFRAEAANTPGTPGFSFQGDINTGFFRKSEDTVGFSAGGIQYGEFGVGYGGFTGNIIQSVFAQTSTQKTNASGTPINVGMPCIITPKYINSKIIILYSIGGCYSAGASTGIQFRLYKNGSNVVGTFEDIHCYNGASDIGAKYYGMFYDTPNTTSPITYEPYFASRNGLTTQYVQNNNSFSSIMLLEVQQ